MDLYQSTLSSTTLSWSEQVGPWIHMFFVARDTLRSIYGKSTQLQNTVYLAPMKRSQIKGSVVCRNQWTDTYRLGIWESTHPRSWWHEPISG